MSTEIKKNLINGEWVEGTSSIENLNPADINDVVGVYASGNTEHVNAAAEAAHQAQVGWAGSSPQVRADILERVGLEIVARKDEIGHLLAREEGKTLVEATGEAMRAGQIFKFFAAEAIRVNGDALDSVRPGVDITVTREAVGVVGLITPWNFPVAIPAWKIAPALAYGNAVVFKPAELVPGCAHLLAEILHEAGIPAGVFNLVMGTGRIVGSAIVEHPLINAISFTGSVPVGRQMAIDAAKNLKKIQLEMGGKNPMVIMDDADLAIAVPTAINSGFYSTGQRCTASSRLIVHEGIYDSFAEKLIAATEAIVVGNPLDEKVQMGPVSSAAQLEGNLEYVNIAKQDGAKVIGGERIVSMPNGYFQRPALFMDATNQMRSSREEIFGPCVSVIKVTGFDEAVAVANDTEFGLSAGICTGSLKYSREFKHLSEAGMVMTNLPTAGVDYHVPFGGSKGSSYGSREQGRYAAEFYTTVKTAYSFAG